MKRRIAWGAGMVVAVVCTAAWAQSTLSPREELKKVRAAPDKAGKSLDEHLVAAPGTLKWQAGPPALPRGIQMAVIEGDPSAADRLFTVRLRIPDGTRIAPHFHSTDEHVTVLSGEFQIGMGEKFDEKALSSLPAGGFVALPAGHAHFARARGATELQLHGAGAWTLTYINPSDDPRRGVGGAGSQQGR